jgi:FtsH-binding integral membrane protein
MTILSDPYAPIATVSLIIQVIVLLMLFYGYSLKRNSKFWQHGRIMAVALILHLIMIFGYG